MKTAAPMPFKNCRTIIFYCIESIEAEPKANAFEVKNLLPLPNCVLFFFYAQRLANGRGAFPASGLATCWAVA